MSDVTERFARKLRFRHQLSLVAEIVLWCAVMALLIHLAWDARNELKRNNAIAWRDLVEILVIGLLVWWPILRTRIKFGYWMRDWDDSPDRHFSEN